MDRINKCYRINIEMSTPSYVYVYDKSGGNWITTTLNTDNSIIYTNDPWPEELLKHGDKIDCSLIIKTVFEHTWKNKL